MDSIRESKTGVTTMSMIKKWITIPEPNHNDYWHDGEIIEAIGVERFLVRLRNVTAGPQHSRIFSVAALADGFVFETESELDQWREWADQPEVKILKFEK